MRQALEGEVSSRQSVVGIGYYYYRQSMRQAVESEVPRLLLTTQCLLLTAYY